MNLESTELNDGLQQEKPVVVQEPMVFGQPLNELPKDLYIPPNALQVFLDTFTGPLDLLLYLIKKQNIDILDIPIAKITAQYMEYIGLMSSLQIELAAEYLVMASMLAEIKSRLLLPKPPSFLEGDEVDPRAQLVQRLQEYERFKQVAEKIDNLPRMERDVFAVQVETPEVKKTAPLPTILLQDLLLAFKGVLDRALLNRHHRIKLENLSVRERMSDVLSKLQDNSFITFHDLFNAKEGKLGVVVSFIAILELLRQELIQIIQCEQFGVIHLKLR
jgi:segregation and condensation protein A